MNTNRTPGAASAADVSIQRIDARAYGLRTKKRVQHPGEHDVVDEDAVTGEQPRVLDAVDARADVAGRGHAIEYGATAVDRDDRAGDERRAVRGQERRDFGDLVRLTETLERRVLRGAGVLLEPGAHDLGLDVSGTDRVHADARARVLHRSRLRERDDAGLGRRVHARRDRRR